jgi:hypothetical protein
VLVNRVDPVDCLRLLNRINVGNVYYHLFIVRAHEHALKRLVQAGIDLLVWDEGRHVDEVAGPGLCHILEVVAPAHAGLAAHHVNHAFKLAMVVHARLGVWLNSHCSGPDLLGTDTGVIDRGLPEHAWCLDRIGVKPVALEHPHPVMLPRHCVVMGMVGIRRKSGVGTRK